MASTIQLKTGTGSAVPSSLTQGEVAINIDNGLIYYGSGSTNTTKQLESFTHITASGDISASGTIEAGGSITAKSSDYIQIQVDQTDSGKATLGLASGTGEVFLLSTTNNASYDADIKFLTNDGSTTSEVVRFKEDGKVGIGNAAPPEKLTVAGNISASGNIITEGHITASGDISASGTVTMFTASIGGGTFTSASLASAIAGGSGGGTTTNALTVDNATLQLNSGTTFDGSAARTISIKDGGVDSDALAANITVTQLTASFISSSGTSSLGMLYVDQTITASGISSSGTITGNSIVGTVGTATQGTIDHDSLANFVANEHIDHTSVTLSAGNGLSGGGDISANRSFAVDAAQTTITSVTNTGLKVGRATDDTYIDFGTDDKIQLKPANSTALEVETTGIDVTGDITASGNISASGQIFSNTYYQWEATARCDTDDDSNWQGPNSKGLIPNEDWAQDYGTDYDDNSSTNAESRLYMNTGWWVPHGANYSASVKSMDIYVQANSNITHADADFFSCSLWYSHNSDLQGELNVPDANAGTFVQRHGASVDSSQCKASDDKFFKYNNYLVTQSINIDLAPGSMLFPRIKTGGTNNFNTNVYWVIHYCKKPL